MCKMWKAKPTIQLWLQTRINRLEQKRKKESKTESRGRMPIVAKENVIAAWVFLTGVLLAVIIGVSTSILPIPFLVAYSGEIYAILVILGLAVGASINVSKNVL